MFTFSLGHQVHRNLTYRFLAEYYWNKSRLEFINIYESSGICRLCRSSGNILSAQKSDLRSISHTQTRKNLSWCFLAHRVANQSALGPVVGLVSKYKERKHWKRNPTWLWLHMCIPTNSHTLPHLHAHTCTQRDVLGSMVNNYFRDDTDL